MTIYSHGLIPQTLRLSQFRLSARPRRERRLRGDIEVGLREPDIIARSIERLPLYEFLDTVKIDTTGITAEEVAERIAAL